MSASLCYFPIPSIIQSWRLRGSEKLEYFISSLYSYTLRLQMTVCCLSTATCELINVKADRMTPSIPSHSYPHLHGVAPRQKKSYTSLTSNTERMKRRTQGTRRPYFIRQISSVTSQSNSVRSCERADKRAAVIKWTSQQKLAINICHIE